jgi:hypothetical protein
MEYKVLATSLLLSFIPSLAMIQTFAAILSGLVALNIFRKQIVEAGGIINYIKNYKTWK